MLNQRDGLSKSFDWLEVKGVVDERDNRKAFRFQFWKWDVSPWISGIWKEASNAFPGWLIACQALNRTSIEQVREGCAGKSGLSCEGAGAVEGQGLFYCHFLHKAWAIPQTGVMAYYTVFPPACSLPYSTVTWEGSVVPGYQARGIWGKLFGPQILVLEGKKLVSLSARGKQKFHI